MSSSRFTRWSFGAAVGLVLTFLILPFLVILPMSFSATHFLTFPPPSYGLRWYQEYFGSGTWTHATWVSLTVGILTVLVATPAGVAAAYAIANGRSRAMRLVHIALHRQEPSR